MEKHLHPLPLRAQPQPWEDLHSFLSRTARRMHYDKASHILQPELSAHHIASSHISLLTELADYTLLSDLLLLAQDTLYQMTLHRFSAPFEQVELFPVIKDSYRTKKTFYLHPATPAYHSPISQPRLAPGLRRSFFLPNQTTQICPLCLQENVAYDRLYWQSRYLLTCHKHAILLQRECSTCHKPIPSGRMTLTSCPFCHHDYTNPSSTPVPLPTEATYLLHGDLLTLQALGVTHDFPHPSSIPIPDDPRITFPSAHYFALLRALCIAIHPLSLSHFQTFLPPNLSHFLLHSTITLHTRPQFIPPLHVAIAHWIFTLWPHHFFPFLDALELCSLHTKKPHAFRFFPQHFLLGSAAHDAYALLTSAYRLYHPTYTISTLERRLQDHLSTLTPPTTHA